MNPRGGSQRRRSSRTIPMTLKAVPLKNIQRAHNPIAVNVTSLWMNAKPKRLKSNS